MFKVLDKVCEPTKGSKYSACIDLYAREDVIINAGETKKIPLGVCIDEKVIKMNFLKGEGAKETDEFPDVVKKDFDKWVDNDFYGNFEVEYPIDKKTGDVISWEEFDKKYGTEVMPEIYYIYLEIDKQKLNKFLSSHYLALYPRSSIGAKGLIIPNGCGIIDLDYELELMLILHNPIIEVNIFGEMGRANFENYVTVNYFKIYKGAKVAQIMLKEHKSYLFGIETDKERKGGFGSTDENK